VHGNNGAETHVLLIECADEKGLVHKITGALFRNNHNIVANAEFVDSATRKFFMRTEFSGALEKGKLLKELESILPKGSEIKIKIAEERKKRIVVFATKEHHCLGDLLLRNFSGDLNAEILAVISNRNDLKNLTEKFGVKYFFIGDEGKPTEKHEAEILSALKPLNPDFIVLAKYMKVFSGGFVSKYAGRVVNIHHSFLPAFAGANPYNQAFERGVKIIGATAHFITKNLDAGPIIVQGTIPVDHSYSSADLSSAGKEIERTVLAKALKLVFEDRVFVSGNKTVIFG